MISNKCDDYYYDVRIISIIDRYKKVIIRLTRGSIILSLILLRRGNKEGGKSCVVEVQHTRAFDCDLSFIQQTLPPVCKTCSPYRPRAQRDGCLVVKKLLLPMLQT